MAKGVLMPQAGISVESCIITEWLKKPGDKIAQGDILFSYETDKASFECESTAEGTLLEVFFEEGDEVPVLINVCAIGEAGEDVSSLRPDSAEGSAPAPAAPEQQAAAPVVEAVSAPAAQIAAPVAASGDVKISPRARRLADERHVDTRLAAATGPYGRVIEQDIRTLIDQGFASTSAAFDAVQGADAGAFSGTGVGGRISTGDLSSTAAGIIPTQAGPEFEDIKFTGIRRAISASMTQSLATIPQLTHSFSFNATEIMAYRKTLKANGEAFAASGITIGDIILFAISRLLPKYPDINSHMLDGTTIRRFRDVNLGVAVDTERGLMVPVIKQANLKSLLQISNEVKELAAAAQKGNLSPDNMSGGTFTVSNLGTFSVEHFTPVINPPQTGIIGVNNITQRPYEKDGEIKLYPAMGLSLTYDHRAIDGAPASRFMQELCRTLEHFTMLLAI